jgi:RNA polymerase sigma-70 factor (ECF subfamily)
MGPWSDDEIWRGLQDPGRRQRACWELQRRYAPRLLGYLTRMCHGNRERAEDLLGRTLYKAYQGLVTMDQPCRALPRWLYTVATRTALDEFDRDRREDPLHSPLPLNDEILEATPAREAEEGSGLGESIDAAVEQVLARLDAENPRYRTLLEMEHVGACDRGEIAEATGISRKQLAQYLKRARQRFTQIAREFPALAALESSSSAEVRA